MAADRISLRGSARATSGSHNNRRRTPVKPAHRRLRLVTAVAAAAALGATHAMAGNTWTGGGATTNWSDNNNWGGSQPSYGTLTFTTGGTQGTTSVVDQSYNMNQLLWTGSS